MYIYNDYRLSKEHNQFYVGLELSSECIRFIRLFLLIGHTQTHTQGVISTWTLDSIQ